MTPREEAERWFTEARENDDYYISGRYPDAYKDTIPSKHFTEEKASEALEWAELFLQFAMTNLN